MWRPALTIGRSKWKLCRERHWPPAHNNNNNKWQTISETIKIMIKITIKAPADFSPLRARELASEPPRLTCTCTPASTASTWPHAMEICLACGQCAGLAPLSRQKLRRGRPLAWSAFCRWRSRFAGFQLNLICRRRRGCFMWCLLVYALWRSLAACPLANCSHAKWRDKKVRERERQSKMLMMISARLCWSLEDETNDGRPLVSSAVLQSSQWSPKHLRAATLGRESNKRNVERREVEREIQR